MDLKCNFKEKFLLKKKGGVATFIIIHTEIYMFLVNEIIFLELL